ncbi:MAG TPA: ribose 5-phosphate isomerase B [Firmicutes bacterium]|nr:ribose 5-phosphate isomerase B [Bacillota bacterium]
MKIAIGCDHGGYRMKEDLKDYLQELGYSTADFGTDSEESVDYPDFGLKVAEGVARGDFPLGILICGTGIGMAIVANKVPGIRAALCTDTFMARCSREHNHANILVLGERVIGLGLARDIVKTWLETEPGGGRHQRRVEKIRAIEEGCGGGGGLV